MPRAIISAGHTTNEKGAIHNGLEEFLLNRKIADAVTNELRAQGVLTTIVPYDLSLSERIEWINNTGYSREDGDIAVEIHVNDGGKSGMEGWYQDKGDNQSFRLTKSIIDRVCKDMDFTYQGVKSEYEHPLKQLAFVHMLTPVPALVECLYIDNDEDRIVLQDELKLRELGKSIANGIMDYWEKENTYSAKSTQTDSTYQYQNNQNQLNTTLNTNQGNQTQSSTTPNISQGNYTQQSGSSNFGTVATVGAVAGGAFVANKNIQSNQPAFANQLNQSSQLAQPMQPQMGTQFPTNPISFEERERRRLFIEDLYLKALGRKPSFQDTAYFINNWDGEVNLVKRMLDSQDHYDILQKSTDYNAVQEEIKEKDNAISRLKIEIRDKDGIIENLNRLVIEKNMMISDLRKLVANHDEKKDLNEENKESDNRLSFTSRLKRSIKK